MSTEENNEQRSILRQLSQAKLEGGVSGLTSTLFRNVTYVLCGTVGVVFNIGFMFVIPLAMVVVGSIHVRHCPREYRIPIYMIVMGCSSMVLSILNLIPVKSREDATTPNENWLRFCLMIFKIPINVFLFVWIILGSVWVYSVETSDDHVCHDYTNRPCYCHEGLYLFAFWQITVSWLFAAFVVVLSILGLLLTCLCVCFSPQE